MKIKTMITLFLGGISAIVSACNKDQTEPTSNNMPFQSTVSTFAGKPGEAGYLDASGIDARFNSIKGLAISPDGKTLFVADHDNQCIRKIMLEFVK